MILSAIAEKLKRRSKNDFKGRHFEASLILQAVCWYLRYPLSYRDIEELFLERGSKIGADGGLRRQGASLSIIGSRAGVSATSLFWSAGRQPNAHRIFRVKRPMPRIGGFQSFHTARRTIRGFEAMLWLRKGFDFAGAWTVCEQNRLLSVCFGLPTVNKA